MNYNMTKEKSLQERAESLATKMNNFRENNLETILNVSVVVVIGMSIGTYWYITQQNKEEDKKEEDKKEED